MEFDRTMVLGFDASAKKSPKLDIAIRAWKEMLDSVKAGEVTPEELDAWKAEFGA